MILHRHDVLGSTSDEALRLAQEGAPHGAVVCARQQTAGRGRQGRRWVSPPGNLHVSFLLRPQVAAGRAAEIGFVAALAVLDSVDRFTPGATLKWPNDVLLGGAKLAGVLAEMAGDAIIAGIGVNVAYAPPDMPYPVTSLAAQGVNTTVDDVLAALMDHFDRRLADWAANGFGPVRQAWLLRGPALGQSLRAGGSGGVVTGQFAGLAEDGALLLQTEAGLRRIVAGEVL